MKQRRKRVLLVTNYAWFSYSSPLLNAASYLIEHGWDVSLLAFSANNQNYQLPRHIEKDVHLCIAPSAIPWYKRLLNNIYLLFAWSFGRSLIIFFDGEALVYAPFLVQLYARRVLYYNLEFFNPSGVLARYKLIVEKLVASSCVGVITQHALRADFLSSRSIGRRYFIVPNSPRGPFLDATTHAEKLNVLDAQTSVPMCQDQQSDFVLLCIGTLSKDHLVDQLLNWFASSPSEYRLIVHGWFDPVILKLAKRIAELTDRVVVSERFLSEGEKWHLYQASDAVFVGFSQSNPNLRLAAGSAGKLYDAIRASRPVLAIDSPGMRQIVEAHGIGVVAPSCNELTEAVSRVRANYGDYSSALRKAHQFFSHDAHFNLVIEALK